MLNALPIAAVILALVVIGYVVVSRWWERESVEPEPFDDEVTDREVWEAWLEREDAEASEE